MAQKSSEEVGGWWNRLEGFGFLLAFNGLNLLGFGLVLVFLFGFGFCSFWVLFDLV